VYAFAALEEVQAMNDVWGAVPCARAAPIFLTLALTVSACAAVTPPPRFSPVSPADADAPDAATPPPVPVLAGEPEVRDHSPSTTPGDDAAAYYTCPMHPEVKEKSPGSCPKCGMRLVMKAAKETRP
jgi:Heavy metal binding domain